MHRNCAQNLTVRGIASAFWMMNTLLNLKTS
jgi:hypothetical protein